MSVECELYFRQLSCDFPLPHGRSQGAGAVPSAAEDEEQFEEMVRSDCAALAAELTGLYYQLSKKLRVILKGLEDIHRAGAYTFLVAYLEGSFYSLTNPFLVGAMQLIEASPWGKPLEMLVSVQIRIAWEILEFRLGFPELGCNAILSMNVTMVNLLLGWDPNGEPPLIEEQLIRDKLGGDSQYLEGKLVNPSQTFRRRLGLLQAWVYALYWRLGCATPQLASSGVRLFERG